MSVSKRIDKLIDRHYTLPSRILLLLLVETRSEWLDSHLYFLARQWSIGRLDYRMPLAPRMSLRPLHDHISVA
jgi:hypothetical protein